MRLIIACLLFCVMGSSGASGANPPSAKSGLAVTAEKNGKVVSIPAGTKFEVKLDGNITTGYQWQVSEVKGDSVRQLAKGQYEGSQPRRIGSGGVFTFPFKAEKSGSVPLKFEYVRPWEKGVSPARTFVTLHDKCGLFLHSKCILHDKCDMVQTEWPAWPKRLDFGSHFAT